MRRIQEPFMIHTHAELQSEINDMMIAIKLHHVIDSSKEDVENLAKARANCMRPTWENVCELFNKAYKELDKDKYNPIKY